MALLPPEIGLVVHYSYVFRIRSKAVGEAGKARPAVIMAIFPDREDPVKTGLLYLPITHTRPGSQEVALEISPSVRHAAGLDGAPQWVLISEGNLDTWPEDIFNLPNQPGVFHYGFLPPKFHKQVVLEFGRLYARRLFNIVPRNTPGR